MSRESSERFARAEPPSIAQRGALTQLPIALTPEGHLPPGSPSGNMLRALERRGLARLDPGRRRWERV